MSDKMYPIPFTDFIWWIIEEYTNHNSAFGIPQLGFRKTAGDQHYKLFGHILENPIGPAAGPHTQLAQNIICSYLTGGRFFELKTVQKLDNLKIDKPCIDAQDEGYNVEWSQELSLDESFDEYLKAWMLTHFLKELFALSDNERGFIFNMSVGYDLEGIKTERMDRFIEGLKDASSNRSFENYRSVLLDTLDKISKSENVKNKFGLTEDRIESIKSSLINIPAKISNSVTLSTMHGCPPQEIEAIAKYLIKEKELNTYVKLNPTLLGNDYVNEIIVKLGYKDIELDKASFDHDLKYDDAILMINRLRSFASAHNKTFGIKLSNTLGVKNTKNILPGKDMYMSGRSLFPLTINLAYKLALDFNGELNISYSGGANAKNVSALLETGIKPVTFATDLLKPGGYLRLAQISDSSSKIIEDPLSDKRINLAKLKELAEKSLTNKAYLKEAREIKSIKILRSLPLFDCYIAPCAEACPIHQDVASYVKLVEQKRFDEAFELIVSKNPLPHITGYICDHQCMFHCTRWDYDEPVLIRDLKKEAAEKGYENYLKKFEQKSFPKQNNIRAAIIGAGPSGLSAGYFLAKAGFDVTIFEKEMNAGGIVKNVLPRFRLPEDAINKDLEFIEKHGVRFVFGFDPDFSIARLKKEGYKYIYVAIGAEISNEIKLEGTKENVFDAIEFLKDYSGAQGFTVGKNVAVIGGGNSAMDSARAAKRYEGVENVFLIYRRTKEQMPADKEEFYAALEDGVQFKELLLPVKFADGKLTCQKMKLDKVGEDGRTNVIPIENEFEEIKIDSVISAISEHTDTDLLLRNRIAITNKKISVSKNNETSIENVFIGGDALRGPSTVVESIADGKNAAEAIIKKENATGTPQRTFEKYFDYNKIITEIEERKGVIEDQQNPDYQQEASRCLGCNFLCNKCIEVCPNRANIAIDTGSYPDVFKDKYQVLHVDILCNECGNCETFCPYQSAPYKNKLTLFHNENDFESSANDGFFIQGEIQKQTALIRINSIVSSITLDAQPNVDKDLELSKISLLIEILRKDYNYLLAEKN